MIKTSSYPEIQLNKTNTKEGILVKKALIKKSFLTKDKNTLFTSEKNTPLLSMNKLINSKKKGYLLEILFHGFNFSARRLRLLRSKYTVDTHKSEIYVCDEPITTTIKSRVHKRRLIFFSYDSHLLHQLEKAIKDFKRPDAYTGKGLFERNDSYTIKQRKKRK